MFVINENEKEYRFGDNGPKYLMDGPRVKFGVVQLLPGQDFRSHYHNIMEENFFMLEGEIEFTIDGEAVLCKQGDLIHVEPKEAHYLHNKSDKPAKAVFCLGPATDNDKVEL